MERFIKETALAFCAGLFIFGIFPLLLHQQKLAGAWFLPTYGANDSSLPSLAAIPHNVSFYMTATPGSEINWWLLALIIGFTGFAFLALKQRPAQLPTTQSLTANQLALATFVLWVFPAAYFLTHQVVTGYYLIPSTFAAALFLTLGVFMIETNTPAPSSSHGSLFRSTANGWRGLALALALVPGGLALERAWDGSQLPIPPLSSQARRVTLPDEVADERAWVWADIYTGTLWYYAQKPAYKIVFSDPATRALVFRFVFDRGEPQYLIRDSPDMQKMMDEISGLGGTLEPRGEIDHQPYYLIHWPQGGPATANASQTFKHCYESIRVSASG